MRLTLRTLLAYLDDRLPPANAREIGQKIAGSPFATELTERIKDVVRRRRLAIPDKPQPVIESNLVAEYLDDQLTPELVAKIEREILQSDAALAEVAATHEILGALRDPVALEPHFRDRLYALDPSGRVDVVRTISGTTPSNGAASAQRAETTPEWKPLSSRRMSSRRLLNVALAVMAIVWIVLMVGDSNLFRFAGNATPQNSETLAQADATPDPAADASDNAAVAPIVNPLENSADVAQSAAELRPTVDANSAGPGPEPSVPSTDATGKTRPTDQVASVSPATTPVAVLESPQVASAGNPELKPAAAAAPAVNAEPPVAVPEAPAPVKAHRIFMVDEHRMAMLLDASAGDWKRAAKAVGQGIPESQLTLFDWRDAIHERWIGILEPFRLRVSPDGTGWTADVAGRGIVQVINSDPAGLAIMEGRVLLSREVVTTIPDDAPVSLALQLGLSRGILTLDSPGTRIGLEVISESPGQDIPAVPPAKVGVQSPPPEPGTDAAPDAGPVPPSDPVPEVGAALVGKPAPAPAAPVPTDIAAAVPVTQVTDLVRRPGSLLPLNADLHVRLYVLEGTATLAPDSAAAAARPTELSKSQTLTWHVLSDGQLSGVTIDAGGRIPQRPEWIERLLTDPVPERKAILTQVSEKFASADSTVTAVKSLVAERNPEIGATAVHALALTRNVEGLMTIWFQAGDESIRRSAVNGLSLIAGQTEAGRNAIRQALETRLPMSEVGVMMKLIEGVSETDARNRAISADLIALLSHDRLVTRELAFFRMYQYTSDRMGFHADSDAGRRREAVRRWQRYLDRQDGTLLP